MLLFTITAFGKGFAYGVFFTLLLVCLLIGYIVFRINRDDKNNMHEDEQDHVRAKKQKQIKKVNEPVPHYTEGNWY